MTSFPNNASPCPGLTGASTVGLARVAPWVPRSSRGNARACGLLPLLAWLSVFLAAAGVSLTPLAIAQDGAAEQYEQIVAGTWRSHTTGEAGSDVVTTVEYLSNGRFSGTRRISLSEIGQILAISGNWSVKAIGEGRFALTRRENGAAAPEVEVLRVIDDDKLLNEAAGYELHRIPDKVRDPNAPTVSEE
jgi:hypothetical protein